MRKLILLLAFAGLTACETVVYPDLDTNSTPVLVVDAFVTNEAQAQTIRLTETIGFLDRATPPSALGATVVISNSANKIFTFIDEKNDGNYIWRPTNHDSLGAIGTSYTLTIRYKGEEFTAASKVNRVPPIDSLTVEFKKAGERGTLSKEGYYVSLFAKDFVGVGDCYRIKTFRNDTLFNKPNELNLAYDASFNKGGGTDGTSFILPIRNQVTRAAEPYKIGDKVRVEIHSITEDTFTFLQKVRQQQQNGGLFATPPVNVGTNIFNKNPTSKTQVLGWFNVAARSQKTIEVKK
jgi:hypothetical protein